MPGAISSTPPTATCRVRSSGPDGAGGVLHLTYCGRLECLEGENLHRIELSSDPALRGTAQRRAVRLDGDRMTLTAAPSIAYGPGTRAEILWRRAV